MATNIDELRLLVDKQSERLSALADFFARDGKKWDADLVATMIRCALDDIPEPDVVPCPSTKEAARRNILPSLLDELARTRAELAAASERLARANRFDCGDGVAIEEVTTDMWEVNNLAAFTRLHPSGQWVATPDDNYEDDAQWVPWETASFPTADAAFAALAAARRETP